MLFFILWVVIAFWFGFTEDDFFMGILFGLIVSLLLFFILCCIPYGEIETYDDTYELRAVVDNYQYEGYVYGNIFVIRGTVDEELQYQFMYKVEDKGWTTKEMDADRVYLNFNCEKAEYIVRQERHANPILQKWIPYNGSTTYILNLPDEATVIDSYIVDFQ